MSEKTTVIYHSADYDGIFCREIARKFLPEAELIGWNYGEPVPAIEPGTHLYMLDISIDGLMDYEWLVWIDHHKSAMEKFHHGIPGYRIDGVAACRLAYQWFNLSSTALEGEFNFEKVMAYFGVSRFTDGVEPHNNNAKLPDKLAYVSRQVIEPLAVRLAGEYDIWDKRDPDAEIFQFGLRSKELTETDWTDLLECDKPGSMDMAEFAASMGIKNALNANGTMRNPRVGLLLLDGTKLQSYQQAMDAGLVKGRYELRKLNKKDN